MCRKVALDSLRIYLRERGFDVMIIPSNDCHFGEYVPGYFNVITWLSGFSGSAGTLVVTQNSAALWTDSRYFIQAASQIKGTDIKLMKIKMEGTPSIFQWISYEYTEGCKIVIDGALVSYAEYCYFQKEVSPSKIIAIDDPFVELWRERPILKFDKIELHEEKFSGESVVSKHNQIIDRLKIKKSFAYLLSTCDDIMWLCNIRGNDIDYNPVALSYSVITNEKIFLFVAPGSLSPEASSYLSSQSVEIKKYDEITSFLKNLPEFMIRIVSPEKISVKNYFACCTSTTQVINDPTFGGTVSDLKSVKNRVEIEGFNRAFLEDGIAWCKLLKFIEDNIDSGLLNEYNIAKKLIEYRRLSTYYRGESFEPIIAFNANGAAAHYSFDNEKNAAKITKNGFLLMDTGAHYPFGTTDTTRTISLSKLSQKQIDDYTLILKGMIQLSIAKFPKGTRGEQLDILARGPIFGVGKMYFHGTGHGIGHYLCVHEGPQSIRMEYNPVTLLPGMILSNEPAVYVEGEYGIRTENVLLVAPWYINDINSFYQFETLTLVPIDTTCINKKLLGKECIDWLNVYHKNIYKALSPHLSEFESKWLKNKTKSI